MPTRKSDFWIVLEQMKELLAAEPLTVEELGAKMGSNKFTTYYRMRKLKEYAQGAGYELLETLEPTNGRGARAVRYRLKVTAPEGSPSSTDQSAEAGA